MEWKEEKKVGKPRWVANFDFASLYPTMSDSHSWIEKVKREHLLRQRKMKLWLL